VRRGLNRHVRRHAEVIFKYTRGKDYGVGRMRTRFTGALDYRLMEKHVYKELGLDSVTVTSVKILSV